MTNERFCELDTRYTGEKTDDIEQLSRATFTGLELKEYVEHFVDAELEELKGCNAVLGDSINFQQAEIKKLREALERIRPWISRITDGILADWQEDLCWDIDLICAEALKDGK